MRIALSAFFVAAALAPSVSRAADVWAYGIGQAKCAQWVPGREEEITGFIFGYWTATNDVRFQIGKSADVGSLTESEVAIAEVRSLCRRFPGMLLKEAIAVSYVKIMTQEAKERR